MNLDQAAAKALTDVNNLITQFAEGYKAFDQLEENLKKVSQEVHSDWPPVLEKAKHLLEDIKRQQREIDEEAKHADDILKQLRQKMGTTHQQCQEALHGSRDRSHDLEQHVQGLEPDVHGVLQHCAETGDQLKQGADQFHQELHQQHTDVSQHLHGEGVSSLKQAEDHVEQHSHEYHDHVQGQIMPEIQAKHEEMHQHLDERHQQFDQHLQKLHQDKQEHITQHMQQCHDKHSEVFDVFTQTGHQAQEVIDGLSKAVDAGGTAVHEGMETVGAACDSLGVGMKVCIDIFEELNKIFHDFKFLGL